MNTVPRPPIPQHDHYVDVGYPAILGGGDETLGPYPTLAQAQKACRAVWAPYPGDYAPSCHIRSIER